MGDPGMAVVKGIFSQLMESVTKLCETALSWLQEQAPEDS
jgi:hypothetical protein